MSDVHQSPCFNPDKVAEAQRSMAVPDELGSMSEIFKALAEPLRTRILSALSGSEELCVCDISSAIGAEQSAVSRQLRYLRDHHIVSSRKAAQLVFYTLKDDCIRELLALCLQHVQHRLPGDAAGVATDPSEVSAP